MKTWISMIGCTASLMTLALFQANLTGAQTPTAQPPQSTDPTAAVEPAQTDAVPVSAKQASSAAEPTAPAESPDPDPPRDKTFDLTFDDLKFEMAKGGAFDRSLLTPTINSYHEGTVRLRGYIRPSFSQTGLTKFIFVRDNKECCFGPGAAIFDCVLVRLASGSKTNYTVRPIAIEGRFSLKEYKGPDGKVWSIYRMNDVKVK
jgi:hypothetical protein